jgi:hypothetical protein
MAVSDLVRCWLMARLKLAKKMNPDMVFYYPELRVALLISASPRSVEATLAKACGGAGEVAKAVDEVYALAALFNEEAENEHTRFLDVYMNTLGKYDDPAKIKILKDML